MRWMIIVAAGSFMAGCVSAPEETNRLSDPNFLIAEASNAEKAKFVRQFRTYYSDAISSNLNDLPQAKAATFAFLSRGVRAGLTFPDLMRILADDVFLQTAMQSVRATTELIQYIEGLEIAEIYEAAGVPLDRDFALDPDTGHLKPRPS